MQPSRTPWASPVPNLGLEGYASEVTVGPGEQIRFMVSGPGSEAQVELVRLLHGDPNPAGPGYRDEALDWTYPTTVPLTEQPIDFGSYVEIPHSVELSPTGPFTIALWFCPTLFDGGWHTLAAKWAPDELSYALFCGGNNFLTAAISHDGRSAEWCMAREFVALDRWQLVAFTYDSASGQSCVYQWFKDASEVPLDSRRMLSAGPVHAGQAPLLFGAAPVPRTDSHLHWAHFNGRISQPVLYGSALDSDRVLALARGANPGDIGPLLGLWDFAEDVTSVCVVDLAPHGNHGVAVNAPARAVTGPSWDDDTLFSANPRAYDAVHMHDDDLEDAGWEPSLEITIPATAPSGIYAARFTAGTDQLWEPFVVRRDAPQSKLAFMIPTLTWQAYNSNRTAWSFTEDGVLDRALCVYDVHRDGSKVYYATRNKPTRSWNPVTGYRTWGSHILSADLYFIDWLEHNSFEYDVFADQDLHHEGLELLSSYRCVVLGSHPEYFTESMLTGLHAYVRAGGRVMYLGGNGLLWVTSISRDRPYLMEVRKSAGYGPTRGPGLIDPKYFGSASDGPLGEFRSQPGEGQHSTTLELGGHWLDRGLPPRSLLGIETSSYMFVDAEGRIGYRRLPASWEEPYAFIFREVDDEVIGNFGLNLGTAAGYEMDGVLEWHWEDGSAPVVLAEARHDLILPAGSTTPPVVNITLSTSGAGGAVFSVGSVTWTGSLSYDDYDNSVSRITENVLRRFVDRSPGESVLDTRSAMPSASASPRG